MPRFGGRNWQPLASHSELSGTLRPGPFRRSDFDPGCRELSGVSQNQHGLYPPECYRPRTSIGENKSRQLLVDLLATLALSVSSSCRVVDYSYKCLTQLPKNGVLSNPDRSGALTPLLPKMRFSRQPTGL